jgi:pyridoxal phosphate-dependent aminotransferase EpsN
MHLQPLYAQCERYGGEVAADLFEHGLCLPSSSNLALADQNRVIETVRLVALRSRRAPEVRVSTESSFNHFAHGNEVV